MTVWQPETAVQVTEIISSALCEQRGLNITGHATKSGLGKPVNADDGLSLKQLSGIIDYQPDELVLVAKPGTPLVEIEQALAEKNQMLAFEPPHMSRFYNSPGSGSIGGIVAANLSGPRRISAGAARDFLLGFSAVSGRGGEFKSGSRVMKNVTGYDLSKLMCGSFGRLAVMTDLTLKLLPQPETSASLSVTCETLVDAQTVLAEAFCTDTEPSGGAIIKIDAGWQAMIRLEGVEVSVRDRMNSLKAVLNSRGEHEGLERKISEKFWRDWRNIGMISTAAEQVYKVCVTPSMSPQLVSSLLSSYTLEVGIDWAGGLVWLGGQGEGLCAAIRQAVRDCGGGHATLVRAAEEQRRDLEVFQPQDAALSALLERIKTAFDPKRILNPGKMGKAGKKGA